LKLWNFDGIWNSTTFQLCFHGFGSISSVSFEPGWELATISESAFKRCSLPKSFWMHYSLVNVTAEFGITIEDDSAWKNRWLSPHQCSISRALLFSLGFTIRIKVQTAYSKQSNLSIKYCWRRGLIGVMVFRRAITETGFAIADEGRQGAPSPWVCQAGKSTSRPINSEKLVEENGFDLAAGR
jgi:hypothetical protein